MSSRTLVLLAPALLGQMERQGLQPFQSDALCLLWRLFRRITVMTMRERTPFIQSSVFKILLFIVGTILLAAAIAPFLYMGGKHVVAEGWLRGGWADSLHGSLARAKFSRYFNRSVLIAGAILLWPTLLWLRQGKRKAAPKTGSWRTNTLAALELSPNPQWWSHLLIGFLLAGGGLLLIGWFYVARGWYTTLELDRSLGGILLASLGTGIVVGLLEEFLFRGALQAVAAGFLRARGQYYGIALFFALVHFFNPPTGLDVEQVTAGTGFVFIGDLFRHFFSQFANPSVLLAEFAVLFAIGLVLGYTRMKTRSLWLGIGLHGGWVFGVKTYSSLAVRTFPTGQMMPWLGDNLRIGAVSCIVASLTGVIVWLWLRKRYGDPFAEAEE